MAGFCHIGIPKFGLTAQSLYEALKGNDSEPLRWNFQHFTGGFIQGNWGRVKKMDPY